jgi:hypothetical protein
VRFPVRGTEREESDAVVGALGAGSGVIGLSLAAQRLVRNVVCLEVNPDTAGAFQLSKAWLAQQDEVSSPGGEGEGEGWLAPSAPLGCVMSLEGPWS